METTVVCKDGSQRGDRVRRGDDRRSPRGAFVDLTESRRTQRALAARVEELRAALDEITRLRRLLPVCAWCHKLRNDDGYWLAVEEFLAQSRTSRSRMASARSAARATWASTPGRSFRVSCGDQRERAAR